MIPKAVANYMPYWLKKRKQWEKLGGADRALWFAKNVKSGKMPSCLRIKQAVDRFYQWKKEYRWDAKEVDDRVRRIANLKPPEGRLEEFVVLPWQAFMAGVIHGFRRPDGKRACREILLVVPRKSGKSSFVAAMMLGELSRPPGNIKSPIIACVGINDETADMTFSKAKLILTHDKNHHGKQGFVGKYKVKNLSTQIVAGTNGGRMYKVTLGSKNREGHTLSAYVADEISQMPSRSALSGIRSGMHHAFSPVIIMTTTPADRDHSALHEELVDAIRVLEGEDERPGYFPIIFRAEEEDKADAGDPALWERVMPSLGWGDLTAEDIHVDWMSNRATEAGRHEFYTRQLCAPSHPPGGWLTAKQVEGCHDPDMPDTPDRSLCNRWLVGLDLSDVDDMTAICLLGYDDETQRAYAWFEVHAPSKLVPAGDVTARDAMRLRDWARDGWLHVHPGGVVDDQRITDSLEDLVKRYQPLGIYADSYTKLTDIRALAGDSTRYRLFQRGKSKKLVAEPMNVIASWASRGNLAIQQHPVFLDHVRNVVIDLDRFGGRIPAKETPTSPRKIDAVDAFIMAVFGYCNSRDDAIAGKPEAPVVVARRLPGQGDKDASDYRPYFLGED